MNPKEKKQLGILIIGIIILIWAWIYTHRPDEQATVTDAGVMQFKGEEILPISPERGLSIEETAADLQPTAIKEIKYTGRENRDPLDNSGVVVIERLPEAPLMVEQTFPVESFSVSAIIWDSKKPQAIINGKIVTIGEKLNGGEIIGIDKEGVHVTFAGKEVLLPIK